MPKKRIPIPSAVAAQAEFESDRTCCICQIPGKPYQIHHIDDDPSNNDIRNLAILCRDHHDETMIKGGFNRKLNADLITLYRDDWVAVVVQRRGKVQADETLHSSHALDFSLALDRIEVLKGRKEYSFLAMEYDRLGNPKLRDKYIELALKQDPSDFTTMFLRDMQGQPTKIPPEVTERVILSYRRRKQWHLLGRTYHTMHDAKNAAINYCKSIIKGLEKGNTFSAAFYLKELAELELHVELFKKSYEDFSRDENLWWAYRSLQELSWRSEADEFLLRNEQAIIESGDHFLLKELYAVKGDVDAYRELELKEADSIYSDAETGAVGFTAID
jgi:hypothetical protein